MTEAKQSFAAKLGVAFVAAAMVFSFAAPAANAQQSAEELQQMINDLLAQVATLQSQLGEEGGGSTAGGPAGVCPYTWTRDLSQGSTGNDVMKLQQFLNSNPDTRVAPAGQPGGPGSETDYYGPATAAAVSKMQTMYRADVLTPAGLQNPTGYFGPSSRTKANELCVAPTPDPDDDMTENEDEDATEDEDEDATEDEDDEVTTLGGVANLQDFEVNDASDSDVQEGQSDVEIGTFEIEFDNGDAEISYMDIALEGDNSNNGDEDPWDNFENVSLWMDGEKMAEVNADDEDDYLDEEEGELRFSNLGVVAMEDETVEVVVGASLQDNLDGLASNNDEEWMLYATGMRFFDADGVATTESNTDDLDGTKNGTAANFTIEEAGAGEEVNVSLGSSNPDSTNIVVDTDSDTNDVTTFAFDVEAEDGDIEFDKMVVRVDTPTVSTIDVVDDAYIEIDGMTFEAESVSGTGAPTGMDSTEVNAAGEGVWYVFDIDGDLVIDEDDEMEALFMVDLNEQDAATYDNGQQLTASIGGTETDEWDAEGAEDLDNNDYSGSATGDDHTLVAEGIVLPVDGVTVDESTSGNNDNTGSFDVEFEVTAVEKDFYVFDKATEGAFNSTTTGLTFEIDGPATAAATSSGVVSTTADEDNGNPNFYVVREGETETFTMTVTLDTDVSGQHRVSLTGVGFSEDTDDNDSDDDAYQPVPAQDFRTDYINVNANASN
jgi:hypothetical protein